MPTPLPFRLDGKQCRPVRAAIAGQEAAPHALFSYLHVNGDNVRGGSVRRIDCIDQHVQEKENDECGSISYHK